MWPPRWPRAYQYARPAAHFRVHPEDFVVDEQLGFEASGAGEFYLVQVEKRKLNTPEVAARLARFADVAQSAVSWSGLKDRVAVTRQYFSVHMRGPREVAWGQYADPAFDILDAQRHHRKLRRGAHRSNHFCIRLRQVEGGAETLVPIFDQLRDHGVPNYFGGQRFGRGGANLDLARRLFAGARLRRMPRSLALSAARAFLFNQILAERVADGSWCQGRPGDLFMLRGKRAVFGPETVIDQTLQQRLAQGEIDPTGALWGGGGTAADLEVSALEQGIATTYGDLADGLAKQIRDGQRRALRFAPTAASITIDGDDALLSFTLPAGVYATAVLRELIDNESLL